MTSRATGFLPLRSTLRARPRARLLALLLGACALGVAAPAAADHDDDREGWSAEDSERPGPFSVGRPAIYIAPSRDGLRARALPVRHDRWQDDDDDDWDDHPRWRHRHHERRPRGWCPPRSYGWGHQRYAPVYRCGPCGHDYGSYNELSLHIGHRHHVPWHRAGRAIFRVNFGFLFGG